MDKYLKYIYQSEIRLGNLKKELENKQELLLKKQNYYEDVLKIQGFIQKTAKATQKKLKICIEDIVNLCINSVFPNKYEFRMDFVIKRNKTECELNLYSGENVINPMKSNGGGLIDIISFGLRMAVWTLSNTNSVIIFDEPFKFLSRDLQPFAGDIFKELRNKLDLQIIMVTHLPELANIGDNNIKIVKKKEVSFLK